MASIISGTNLPNRLEQSSVIEHDDSFVIIGGLSISSTYSDKIYRYDVSLGGWTELQTTLSQGKWLMTAMKIKPAAFDSCNSNG